MLKTLRLNDQKQTRIIIIISIALTLYMVGGGVGGIISVQHSQYHFCWSPGSLRRQDINTHDTDYV